MAQKKQQQHLPGAKTTDKTHHTNNIHHGDNFPSRGALAYALKITQN
jgi:hypothetical protein